MLLSLEAGCRDFICWPYLAFLSGHLMEVVPLDFYFFGGGGGGYSIISCQSN